MSALYGHKQGRRGQNTRFEPRYSNTYRIGIIVPSLNVTIEPEFNAIVPRDISVHATRLLLERGDARSLERMARRTEEACELLASACVDVIAYACTTGSLVGGERWEANLIRRMKSSVSVPVITTAGAVIDALKELGLKRIAVATPYTEELNAVERKFLESNGIEVTKIIGLGCVKGEDLHKYPPSTTKSLALRVDSEEAQGIFLSCTDLKTITVVDSLERTLRKPVVSSNIATLWKALRMLGYKKRSGIPGCGSLLRHI